jgi:hypothetical protein
MDVSGETGWVLNRWRAIEQRETPRMGEHGFIITDRDLDRGSAFMDVGQP